MICIFKGYITFKINKIRITNPLKCIRKFSKIFLQYKINNIKDWNPNNRGYRTCNEKLKALGFSIEDNGKHKFNKQWIKFWSGELDLVF